MAGRPCQAEGGDVDLGVWRGCFGKTLEDGGRPAGVRRQAEVDEGHEGGGEVADVEERDEAAGEGGEGVLGGGAGFDVVGG